MCVHLKLIEEGKLKFKKRRSPRQSNLSRPMLFRQTFPTLRRAQKSSQQHTWNAACRNVTKQKMVMVLRVWSKNNISVLPKFSKTISTERLTEANKVADTIITACTTCLSQMKKASKNQKFKLNIYDISTIIEKAIS